MRWLLLFLIATTASAWPWTFHYEWSEYTMGDGFTLTRPGTIAERLKGHTKISISLPSGTIIRVPRRVMGKGDAEILPDKGTPRAAFDNFMTPDRASRDTLEVGTPRQLATLWRKP